MVRQEEMQNDPRQNCEPAWHNRKGQPGNPLPSGPAFEPVDPAELLEGRTEAKGNSARTAVTRTQSWGQALTGLGRVREAAKKDRNLRFTNLLHHVTPELLWEAFFSLKKAAAPGVDGMTWTVYRDSGLMARLRALHDRVQQGSYHALPSRRTWIPKSNGEMRGLGIAALEDKIVQLALVWVLEAIYEVDFLGFSYGFRPGRNQHDALDALEVSLTRRRVNWVIDADVRKFFDRVDHTWLLRFLGHRIADQRVLRLIVKWLKAGVLETGQLEPTETGTPQGAVISPLLANIVLHYVLDQWIHWWRQTQAHGLISIVRYADDFVIGCERREDAVHLFALLFTRFTEFGLTLHSEKTRLIEFGRFALEHARRDGTGKPETFVFLGFVHICSVAAANKWFKILRLSRKDRLRTKLHAISEWLREHRHQSIPEQGQYLRQVVRGWFQYHAVPGNNRALNRFRTAVGTLWLRALRRRSQRGVSLTWERMNRYIQRWLPPAKILHPYPSQRFALRT